MKRRSREEDEEDEESEDDADFEALRKSMIVPTEEEKALGREKKELKEIIEKEKLNWEVYFRLRDALRPLASDPKKSDIEIFREFIQVDFGVDKDRLEECICGKQHLYYLSFMQQKFCFRKPDEDFIDTFIVGTINFNFCTPCDLTEFFFENLLFEPKAHFCTL